MEFVLNLLQYKSYWKTRSCCPLCSRKYQIISDQDIYSVTSCHWGHFPHCRGVQFWAALGAEWETRPQPCIWGQAFIILGMAFNFSAWENIGFHHKCCQLAADKFKKKKLVLSCLQSQYGINSRNGKRKRIKVNINLKTEMVFLKFLTLKDFKVLQRISYLLCN